MNETITLVDELGENHEFIIIATFDLDDDKYAVLLPADDLEGQSYILRVERNDDGEILLIGIEDDKELQDAIDAYEEIQSENLQ